MIVSAVAIHDASRTISYEALESTNECQNRKGSMRESAVDSAASARAKFRQGKARLRGPPRAAQRPQLPGRTGDTSLPSRALTHWEDVGVPR